MYWLHLDDPWSGAPAATIGNRSFSSYSLANNPDQMSLDRYLPYPGYSGLGTTTASAMGTNPVNPGSATPGLEAAIGNPGMAGINWAAPFWERPFPNSFYYVPGFGVPQAAGTTIGSPSAGGGSFAPADPFSQWLASPGLIGANTNWSALPALSDPLSDLISNGPPPVYWGVWYPGFGQRRYDTTGLFQFWNTPAPSNDFGQIGAPQANTLTDIQRAFIQFAGFTFGSPTPTSMGFEKTFLDGSATINIPAPTFAPAARRRRSASN
jgi:hypothetical protein